MAEVTAGADGRADFFFLKPGDYYMRCYVDRDSDGEWDTGKYADALQPEMVFYFPKPIRIKAKWDMEQDWSPLEIPRINQKPIEITKQKPDKQKNIKQRNKEREQQKQQEKNG